MIIHQLDEATKSLVENVIPRWTEVRARKSRFSKPDASTIKSLAIMLAGEPSLECWVKSRDLIKPRIEYFPIGLECRDPMASDTFEWITIARKGGTSEFERKIQWLFEKPSLRLLISEEECADGMEPEARQYLLRFYGSLEISDPKGRGKLHITASEMPDFIVTLSVSF
jgi:hypothetical protein